MADRQLQKQASNQNADTRSVISRCGSISGEALVSLRSRRYGDDRTPRRSVDVLARTLREYHNQASYDNSSLGAGAAAGKASVRQRLNNCFHHYRFFIALISGMSVGIMMFLRYSMTIAILQMVNQTHLYLEEHPNKTLEDFTAQGYVQVGEFPWNHEVSD